MKYFRFLIGATVATFGWASGANPAEPSFPDRPLRIVVPFAPGGGSDLVARVLASRMPEVLGQNGVVDNRPGGASLLATQLVAQAPNDGYTLVLQDLIPFSINNTIYSNAGYDPVKSFSPVAQVASTPLMLVINPSVQVTAAQEFVALAKSQPGRLAIGNAGTGSVTHLAAVLFASSVGIELTMVPYKGTGPALVDVVGGRVHAIIATPAAAMPLVSSGKLRLLAVAADKRMALAPDVPTMQEAGVKGYVVTNVYILVTSARTPSAVLSRLHGALIKILRHPDVAARLSGAMIEPTPGANPQELGAMIAAEVLRWGRVVKSAGIRAE